MNAYDYDLMPRAQKVIGWMFDTAINYYGINLTDFYHMFLNSSISHKIEMGNPSILEGCSGRELTYIILDSNGYRNLSKPEYYTSDRSQSFWLGWSLAYYQWCKGITFSQITDDVSIETFWDMYDKYHEMDILHFVDGADDIRKKHN